MTEEGSKHPGGEQAPQVQHSSGEAQRGVEGSARLSVCIPDYLERFSVDLHDLDLAMKLYANWIKCGDFGESFDINDFDIVARYLMARSGESVWADVLRGGRLGAGIVIHELSEIERLLAIGVDPMARRLDADDYDDAHGCALICEAEFHEREMARMQLHVDDIAALIWYNPGGKSGLPGVDPRDEAAEDLIRARRHRPTLTVESRDLDAAEEYFRRIEKESRP